MTHDKRSNCVWSNILAFFGIFIQCILKIVCDFNLFISFNLTLTLIIIPNSTSHYFLFFFFFFELHTNTRGSVNCTYIRNDIHHKYLNEIYISVGSSLGI